MTASTAFGAYQAKRHFGSLDGLRCLCIVMVLWHHNVPIFGPDPDMPRLLTRGFTGVDFFFVLSGYLITTLLLREEDRNGRFSLTGFYWRRFLRIIPLYFLVVTLVAIWWIGVRGQEQWLAQLPYYYVFLANFVEPDIPLLAPTWSLSVEEQYYLIWPGILLLLTAVRLRLALLLAVILLALLVTEEILPQIEPVPANDVAEFILPMTSYSAILIGSMTGLLLHRQAGFTLAWRLLGARATPIVLFAALCVFWHFSPVDLRGWPNLVMHLLMAAILASLVLREDSYAAPVLKLRPIVRIGVISYGLYLWHLIGRHIGVEFAAALGLEGQGAAWAAMPVYVAASIVIAEISFRYYESYFLAMKTRKTKKGPVSG